MQAHDPRSRRSLTLIILLAIAGALGVMHASAEDPRPSPRTAAHKARWLVMWYFVSSKDDIEDEMLENISDMEAGLGAAATTSDVVVVGQASVTSADFLGSTTAKRFLVLPSHDENTTTTQVLQDLGSDFEAVSSQSLADFLRFAIEKYPAERKLVILSDHGFAWAGWGANADDDQLSLQDTEDAFDAIAQDPSLGTPVFDVVAMNCCSMGGLEVDEMLSRHARFRVSNENQMYGLALKKVVANLADHPETAPRDLATSIAREYMASFPRDEVTDKEETISVADLSQVAPLVSAVHDLALKLDALPATPESLGQLAMARRRSLGFKMYLNSTDSELVDLGQLAVKLADDKGLEPLLGGSAQGVAAAISRAMVLNLTGQECRGAAGVSIFFPKLASDLDAYKDTPFGKTNGWSRFLADNEEARAQAFADAKQQCTVAVVGSAGTEGPNAEHPVTITVSVANYDWATFQTRVWGEREDESQVLLATLEWAPSVPAAITTHTWDGTLLTISDGKSRTFVGGLPDSENNPDLLRVPCRFMRDGVATEVEMTVDRSGLTVAALYESEKNVLAVFEAKPGDTFQIEDFVVESGKTESAQKPDPTVFTIGSGGIGGLTLALEAAPAGTYAYDFEAQDPAGHESADEVAVTVP